MLTKEQLERRLINAAIKWEKAARKVESPIHHAERVAFAVAHNKLRSVASKLIAAENPSKKRKP